MSEVNQKLDLKHPNLDNYYTLQDFELLNEHLKTCSPLEIDEQPIDLFELDKAGKLLPMPQATINVEAVVATIVALLDLWNEQTGQNGILTTSQGDPFTPIFVVEVGVITKNSDFDKLDSKFKDIYFAEGTSVKLGWLIDPKHKNIWSYKKTKTNIVRCYNHGWKDLDTTVNDIEILPKFVLNVKKIEKKISQKITNALNVIKIFPANMNS
ncbi:15719_t:CDS:2 [Dentiscutata erythropus]|uniref:15719_t:CDS:1 n=1 Tax=Dentiscutata erythropus TaxID=1348616 RepID=A0A9N9B4N2_9GLOM|nr:15719_t:CDS:2 [Dentiscutata erythropus]